MNKEKALEHVRNAREGLRTFDLELARAADELGIERPPKVGIDLEPILDAVVRAATEATKKP